MFDYRMSNVSFRWDEASSGVQHSLSDDDFFSVALPFDFPFYGENFSTLYVSTNGWMSFYNTQPYVSWFTSFPTSGEDWLYAVVLYGVDLNASDTIYTQSFTSPNRLVVQYNDSRYLYWPQDVAGTFQAVFYENGTIEFNYDAVVNDQGYWYTAGLNHGPIWTNYETLSLGFPVDDYSVRFDPPEKWLFITSSQLSASSDYTLMWEGHSNETIDMYHVFLDFAFYDNTTSESMLLSSLSNGWHFVEVYMETDGANYTASMSLTVDTDSPVISIYHPTNMSTLNDAKVNWTASDPTTSVEYVEVYVNGTLYSTVQWETWTFVVLNNSQWYNITIVAYDEVGNMGSDTVIIYYERTVLALGFIVTHFENGLWDLQNFYRSLGYIVAQIESSFTPGSLYPYDVLFVGGGGNIWPSADVTALGDYVSAGGKLVVSWAWSFPAGLDGLMASFGIGLEMVGSSPEGNTTIFDSTHSIMDGVDELHHWYVDGSLTFDFPARELVRSFGDNNTIGVVSELGSSKVLCLHESFFWTLEKANNTVMFGNIATNWLVVEDHDLQAIVDAPGAVGLGQQASVEVYVINQGLSTETAFTLELWVDGTFDSSHSVSFLDSGEWDSFQASILVSSPGTLNLTAYVAPQTGETAINNNRDTEILEVYEFQIIDPVAGQRVRGGLVYVNYSASDYSHLENITGYVNSVDIIEVWGVYQYPDLGIFVPVFENGTNTITLVGWWTNGAVTNDTVTVESYRVVPIVKPTPGDYIDFYVDVGGVGFQMYNFTFNEWVSLFEVNCTMYANQTIPGNSTVFSGWVLVNVLNSYVSQADPNLPPEMSFYRKRLLTFTGLGAPETIPYSSSIDRDATPTAQLGDMICWVDWHQIFTVVGNSSWNGYATHVLTGGVGMNIMNISVLQFNGMLVSLFQSGMFNVTGEIVRTNMLPPVDRAPLVYNPPDMNIEAGTSDQNVTWVASGNYPTTYTVYIDGVEEDSGWWMPGVPLVVSVDTLVLGDFNFTIVLYDDNGAWTADTVWIHVQDTTPPTIDSPSDVEYTEGDTGNSITWTPADFALKNYTVYKDGVVVQSGNWTGQPVTADVDGLSLGTYNYTILVFDQSGNTVTDTVIVTVSEEVTTTTTTTTGTETGIPPDNTILLIALSIAGVVIVIVIIMIFRRR